MKEEQAHAQHFEAANLFYSKNLVLSRPKWRDLRCAKSEFIVFAIRTKYTGHAYLFKAISTGLVACGRCDARWNSF
jgi:hypothetical protein